MSSAATFEDMQATNAGRRLTVGDLFVLTSMVLFALALACGLIVQFAIEPQLAGIAAGCVFLAMAAGHIALRRTEFSARRRAWRAQMDADADPVGGDDDPHIVPSLAPATPMVKPAQRPGVSGNNRMQAGDHDAGRGGDGRPDRRTERPVIQEGLASFRPRDVPALDAGTAKPAEPVSPPEPAPAPAPALEAHTAEIDHMIKRLADDIATGRKSRAGEVAAQPRSSAPPAGDARRADPMATGQSMSRPPPLPQRAAGQPAVAAAKPERKRRAPSNLAAIADALSDDKVDVFLETINGLEDLRAHHYEISLRLRLDDGSILDNGQCIAAARGNDLLALFEAVKVSNTKRVARQMIRRGRSGDFFSQVDGEALSNGQFSDDVETITAGEGRLASRLVLSLAQSDVRLFSNAQWRTLDDIARLGFRFSIEAITDLDMDFEHLAERGFAFAKLDADVFMTGLAAGTSVVPSEDICRYLARAGLTLIVGEVRDETVRAKLMGFGALYGQGALFGAPRPVRAEVLREGTPSEAHQPRPA